MFLYDKKNLSQKVKKKRKRNSKRVHYRCDSRYAQDISTYVCVGIY